MPFKWKTLWYIQKSDFISVGFEFQSFNLKTNKLKRPMVCWFVGLQIEELLEETGAGSDYCIDHTLYQACEPVVQTVCKDKGKKEGDVM